LLELSTDVDFGLSHPNEDILSAVTDCLDRTMSLRALKAGDAFDTDVKLQKRYDMEEQLGTPQRLMDWIVKVAGTTNNVPSGGQNNWKTISTFLKDGVVLCKLINALLKSIGMPAIKYRPKVSTNFVAMSNIETFVGGQAVRRARYVALSDG